MPENDNAAETMLPAPDTKRWVARRKAVIVNAVRSGVLSLAKGDRRAWRRRAARHPAADLPRRAADAPAETADLRRARRRRRGIWAAAAPGRRDCRIRRANRCAFRARELAAAAHQPAHRPIAPIKVAQRRSIGAKTAR